MVRCSETIEIRKEFIAELLIELVKANGDEVCINTIMAFGEDILRYLEYKDNNEEYETSQNLIGMKELFRGYVVRVWIGADMSSDKYRKLNKIIVRKCVEFYVKR